MGPVIKGVGCETILTAEKCSFIFFAEDHQGWSIHTSSIHTLDLKESGFYECSTISCNENNNFSQGNEGALSYTFNYGKHIIISCYFYS